MKPILLISIICLLLPPFPVLCADSVVTGINKVSSKDMVEIYLNFSSLPVYRKTQRNKRVDLILENSVLGENLEFFKGDDKIVKILSLAKNNKTIISLFFRYPPQKVDLIPSKDANKLAINILLGNPYSAALPGFASRLSGLTIVERTTKDYSNPLIASPYAADWKSFFRLYESEWKVSLPVSYSILPFPAIQFLLPEKEKNMEILSAEIVELAGKQLWNDILLLLQQQIEEETDQTIKKKLALTYGDVLARDNNFPDAYKQFYLLIEEYGDEEIGILAKYLLILLRARFEDPFIADFEFRNIAEVMNSANPLTPYFRISQIETALATGQFDRMDKILRDDDIGYPGQTFLIRDLRQADYWSGSGDDIKAYIGYQLLDKHEILFNKTYSLNGYCDTLYKQKQFGESAACYNRLASFVEDKETLGMINFRKYMAELHYKNPAKMIDFFSRIENTYPGTDAGFRGAMKKVDLSYLYNENWSETALLHYRAFAEKGLSREIREEASFKVALVLRLRNENIESINQIMKLLRDFSRGSIYREAQALLIELFPLVIKEYVAKKMYVEALVLAKQNRNLFVKNWVGLELLADLAASYNSLGIFDEASKLYLYLINLSSEDEKEQYYLPVIQAAYDQGDYNIVEDYSDQYRFRYPDGRYATDILKIRIQSLVAQNRYPEASAILPEKIPQNSSFSMLAATLYFQEDRYDELIDVLDRPLDISDEKIDRKNFMLAESYYQTGVMDRALQYFQEVPGESIHYDQARYRIAELLGLNGNKEESLKLYQKLTETGKNPLWIRLADEALKYNKISNQY